nr:MAG TPA: hypothetical protein [Caudoviricetes sp.]
MTASSCGTQRAVTFFLRDLQGLSEGTTSHSYHPYAHPLRGQELAAYRIIGRTEPLTAKYTTHKTHRTIHTSSYVSYFLFI